MIEYHAIENTFDSKEKTLPLSTAATEIAMSFIPSPLGFLGSNRTDPFASFAKSLNNIEGFLLDYCKPGLFATERVDTFLRSATPHTRPKKQILGD